MLTVFISSDPHFIIMTTASELWKMVFCPSCGSKEYDSDGVTLFPNPSVPWMSGSKSAPCMSIPRFKCKACGKGFNATVDSMSDFVDLLARSTRKPIGVFKATKSRWAAIRSLFHRNKKDALIPFYVPSPDV